MLARRIFFSLKFFSLMALAAAVAGLAAGSDRAEGSFPGDNGKIVFQSARDGSREIFVMSADGASPVQVSWSADGGKSHSIACAMAITRSM